MEKQHGKYHSQKNRATPSPDVIKDHQDFVMPAHYCGGLIIEHRHGVFCRARDPATGLIFYLPVPHCQHILGVVINYDWVTGETKLIVISKQGYEILKVGDQKWRPLEPNYRKGECMVLSRDRKEILFINLVQTPLLGLDLEVTCFDLRTERYAIIKNFPKGVFSDLTKLIPFHWNFSPAVGELSKEKGLRVLVLENDKWSEEIQQVCSAFFNLHLIALDFVPIEVIYGNLWFQCNGNREYYFCYHIEAGSVTEYMKA